MEVNNITQKVAAMIIKYRYAACVLLVGIVLMLLPAQNASVPSQKETTDHSVPQPSVEEQLGDILSKIQGAGKVEVMLSLASGAETLYHGDSETDGTSERTDTVIVTDSNKNQSALVTRVDPPVYMGAIVVCQGADSASVRLAIVDAVSKYTGLGADQISVLKMK